MQAVKDFNHLGVDYKSGQILDLSTLDAEDVKGLLAKGLIVQNKQKDLEPVKKAHKRSKTK